MGRNHFLSVAEMTGRIVDRQQAELRAMGIELSYGQLEKLADCVRCVLHDPQSGLLPDPGDIIARKVWCVQDVEKVLESRLGPDDDPDDALAKALGLINYPALNGCTDEEWDVIEQAADRALGKR